MEGKRNNLLIGLLMVGLVTICVMGYFLFISNTKINEMILNEEELNAKITKLENEEVNTTKGEGSSAERSITFGSLSGVYTGDVKDESIEFPDGETEVNLYLYEDGGFCYKNTPGLESGIAGYYTFDNNELILHGVVNMGNDIGRTIINDTMTMKINDDNSITDSKLKAELKKSSQRNEDQKGIISTEIKEAIKNKALD